MLRLTILCLAGLCVASCGDDPTPVGPTPTKAPTPGSPTFRASGTVVEIGGGPVADAVVSARSCDDTPSWNYTFGESITDGLGGFQLEVSSGSQSPIGCVQLGVVKKGYVSADTESMRSSNDNLTIKIQRLREVTGRVIEVDGGPVSGVSVSGRYPSVAVSNANGLFVVTEVGTYLTLDKTGYVTRTADVPEGQAADLGIVYLQRAITLAIRSRVSSRISSADVPYELSDMWDQGVFCSPCKAIDLQPGQQNLAIELRWSGDVPLTLWATANYYGPTSVTTGRPGESALTALIPAATRVLLVGVRSETFTQQTVAQPVPFELTAAVQ